MRRAGQQASAAHADHRLARVPTLPHWPVPLMPMHIARCNDVQRDVYRPGRPRGAKTDTDKHARVARPEGFEPPTTAFGGQYSIQLSYGRVSEA